MNRQFPCSAFVYKYPFLSPKLISTVHVWHGGNKLEVLALWDTGATVTCISDAVAHDLSLPATGMMCINTPSGSKDVCTYLVDIVLPNDVTVKDVEVCGSDIGEQNLGVLIGMNIITQGDFAVSNFEGHTSFTFRIPSIKNVNYAQEARLADLVGPPHGPGKRKKKKR